MQVAFGPGATSSSIRTYGVPGGENAGRSSRSQIKDSIDDDGKIISSSLSTVKEDRTIDSLPDAADALPLKAKKAFREPWVMCFIYEPLSLFFPICFSLSIPIR